jgi:predicted RNase H-like HicB family nuclease
MAAKVETNGGLEFMRVIRRAIGLFESSRKVSPTKVSATWSFQVVIEEDELDGGFIAHSPDLRGCWAQGSTVEEATSSFEEAMRLWLAARLEEGIEDPVEQAPATPEPNIAFA